MSKGEDGEGGAETWEAGMEREKEKKRKERIWKGRKVVSIESRQYSFRASASGNTILSLNSVVDNRVAL